MENTLNTLVFVHNYSLDIYLLVSFLDNLSVTFQADLEMLNEDEKS